jgi:hypothetical protein
VVGVLIGLVVDPDGSMDEMWVAIGAYPGLVAGLIHSALLALARRGRTLDELELPRIAAFGAAAGLLPALFPFFVVAGMTERSAFPLWLLGVGIVGAATLVSVVLAVALARFPRARARGNTPASA